MVYVTDLTDKEWKQIEPLLPRAKKGSNKLFKYSRRKMLDAIFYILKTKCSEKDFPLDFPSKKAVDSQYRRWEEKGFFENIHPHLRKTLRQLLSQSKAKESNPCQSLPFIDKKEKKHSPVEIKKCKVGNETFWFMAWEE